MQIITRAATGFVAAYMTFLVPAWAQPPVAPSDTNALSIDANYTPGSHLVQYVVTNRSIKPILAYGVMFTQYFGNGKNLAFPFTQDYTGTLPLVGQQIIAPPKTQIGSLGVGKSFSSTFSVANHPKDGAPVRVVLSPYFVVFDDNAVTGDDKAASDKIFRVHQEIVSAYQAHVAALSGLGPGSDIRSALNARLTDLREEARQALTRDAPEPGSPRIPAAPELIVSYQRLSRYVRDAVAEIDSGIKTPQEALDQHRAAVSAQLTVFTQHSQPASN